MEACLPVPWDAQAPLSSVSLPLGPTEHLWAHGFASFEWKDMWIRKDFSLSTDLDLQPIQRILMCRSPLEVMQMGHVHREIWGPTNYYQEGISSEPWGAWPRTKAINTNLNVPWGLPLQRENLAWINRALYKSLAKWNRILLFLPSLLLNGTMLPSPQSCLLLSIPPLPISLIFLRGLAPKGNLAEL